MFASLFAALLVSAGPLTQTAQEKPSAANGVTAQTQPAKPSRAELEKRLSETLSHAQLRGSFRMQTRGADGKISLSEPREETYYIDSAVKAEADYWAITARVVYGEHDVTLPALRFRVVWADDAPVIVVDDMSLPGLGTYTARVMFYRDYYAGTWFGPDCGGVLSGQVSKAPPPAEEK